MNEEKICIRRTKGKKKKEKKREGEWREWESTFLFTSFSFSFIYLSGMLLSLLHFSLSLHFYVSFLLLNSNIFSHFLFFSFFSFFPSFSPYSVVRLCEDRDKPLLGCREDTRFLFDCNINRCTRLWSGTPALAHKYQCHSCSTKQVEYFMCSVCARVCHYDHQVTEYFSLKSRIE